MTKKHYEAIARIIYLNIRSARNHTRKEHREIEEYADTATAKALADYFEQDNPRFERERFLSACGIETKQRNKCKKGHSVCLTDARGNCID